MPQLIPAWRATPPNSDGELKAEIAKIDHIGLVAVIELAVKGFARLDESVLIKLGAGRQHCLSAVERKRGETMVCGHGAA